MSINSEELMSLSKGPNLVPPVRIERRNSQFSPMLYHYDTALPSKTD